MDSHFREQFLVPCSLLDDDPRTLYSFPTVYHLNHTILLQYGMSSELLSLVDS